MSLSVLLFNNFKAELPAFFLSELNSKYPECLITTVRDTYDFNRWDFCYRYSPRLIKIVNSLNKKNKNCLTEVFTIVTVSVPMCGFIECDDNGKEYWKQRSNCFGETK